MIRLLRIFALLMAASMLIWIAGCGDDEEEEADTEAPTVASVSVAEGQQVAGNTSITVTFSEKMGSATITVSGAAGATTVAGKVATWTPSGDIPPGAHTLTIDGEDEAGNSVEGAVPINITATAPDTEAPELAGSKCDPKDGADGVDPADYPEKITLVFSEALSDASVESVEPDFKFTDELDGDTLTVNFLQYSMPNETEYTIEVSVKDNAGNTADITYSFTTMAKEQ